MVHSVKSGVLPFFLIFDTGLDGRFSP